MCLQLRSPAHTYDLACDSHLKGNTREQHVYTIFFSPFKPSSDISSDNTSWFPNEDKVRDVVEVRSTDLNRTQTLTLDELGYKKEKAE